MCDSLMKCIKYIELQYRLQMTQSVAETKRSQ